MIRILWGREDDSDQGKSEDDKSEDDPKVVEEPSTRNMTADEIEKMTARSADRASRSAVKNLAKDFGFEGAGEMKDWVKTQREAETDALDEQEKATQDANRKEKEYEARLSDLVSDRLDIAVEKQVLVQVSDPKKIPRIAALVRMDLDSDILDTEDDWKEAITEALSSVKDDTPELFAASGKDFGSGDGGAQGDSTKDEDKEAAATKKLTDEFTSRGLIQYIP